MAWDAIDLRTKNGLPLPEADREIILDVAGKAILDSDQDPAVVIRAAERVGRKHDIIQNVRAYATRTINAALHYAAAKTRTEGTASCAPKYGRDRRPQAAGRNRKAGSCA